MRKALKALFVALVLVAGLTLAPNTLAQSRRTALARSGKGRKELHPKTRAAVAALEAARSELQHADTDFGGHKAEAIEAINAALKRLRLALQFEKY